MTYYREHSRKMWHILLRPPLPVYGGSVRWTRCGLNLCEGESTEKRPAENVCKSCERVKERKKVTEKVTTTWRWTQIELARRAGRCDADRALARLSIHMGENMQRFADRIAQYHKEVTP